MTATITTIQTEIKTAIEAAHTATPFVPPVTVRIAETSSAKPPESNVADVVIGFEASAPLGRATTLQLEQYLIPITIRARNADGSQATLNTLHSLTERMRDLLATHHTSTSRVEQLLVPHPFDLPAATTPGVFDHRFTLDMDALRTIAAAATITPADPLPLLTKTRDAVWSAIDNWPAFSGAWTKKFKTPAAREELILHDPAAWDLPAIAVEWGPTEPEWWVNVAQQWPQKLLIAFWFPFERLDLAELRAMQLMQAVYQAAPEGSTVSYVRSATGRPPSKNSPITIEAVQLGRAQRLNNAWKGTIALTLTGNVDPYS